MPVWLGIDYGLARCGLAISSDTENIVFPLATLHLAQCGSRRMLLDRLAALARENSATALVLGLPLLEDGSESLTCRQVRNVAARIRRRLPLPMFFMPELLSSHEAQCELLAAGCRGHKLKAALDQLAACHILESFLALPPERRRAA